MSYTINRGDVGGRLVATPELRESGENKFCYARVALNNRKGETEFYDVTVFGQSAQYLCDYGNKGDIVHFEYALSTYRPKDGYSQIKLTARNVQLVPKPTSTPRTVSQGEEEAMGDLL